MIKVFCLPGAGGSATMYLRWRQHLPSWIKVVPLELSGRGERVGEQPFTTFDEQINDLYFEHFSDHDLLASQPYVFFGHSMGAQLSYQLIHKIQQEEFPLPKALFVSASPAPSHRDLTRFNNFDDEYLIEELKQHDGTPDIVFEHSELLGMILQVLRADYQVCASDIAYDGEPLSIPIHAFAGKKDDISVEDIKAWNKYSKRELTLDVFEGGHFYLKREDSEIAMLKKLTDLLGTYCD